VDEGIAELDILLEAELSRLYIDVKQGRKMSKVFYPRLRFCEA
jgi:hypothetical protein